MSEQKLKRNLTFMQMVAISSGAVIGGWLAEAPYWFETSGAGAAFLFPILAVLLLPVGFAFGELTTMLPYSSSVDAWTVAAFGHKSGFITQWMMYLIQVVEPPLMAFIFTTAVKGFVPLTHKQDMLLALAVIVLWYILSNFNISLTGTLSNIFFFSMVIISIIVGIYFFASGYWSIDNIKLHGGFFPTGGRGIFIGMAVFSLKFIGFEMTPTLVEETNFPIKNIWKIILCALFIPAALYLFVVLAMAGLAPWEEIAAMDMPEPELVAKLGLPMVIGILAIISGLMHALTTLMGFWTSSARVLYGAAELKQLPPVLGKLNKNGQPYIANIVVLAFSIMFALFSGENWVQYIYAISCIAAGFVYFMVCLDAIKLRNDQPDWERPFKAPGGKITFVLGLFISVWIVVGSCLELDAGGYISLAVFCAVGALLYWIMSFFRKKNPEEMKLEDVTPHSIEID